jgi:DNA-binding GntR family transcriptional regulator
MGDVPSTVNSHTPPILWSMKLEGQRTLRGRAHEILRAQLLAGGLIPGQRVNEVQVAAELGVSRGTLREAIRRLEQEGMFISIPHRGTFVRSFTPREAEELQEVRLSLETTAALRVARFWSPPIETFLQERLDSLRAASETPLPFAARVMIDVAFHEGICEASGNHALLELWRSLMGNITLLQVSVGEERMTPLQAPGDHEELLAAIRSRDDARIRSAFARVFEEGRRVVAGAVEQAQSL